ncbi:MAG: single-stranded-DNA-specific exonuclease RecJ [Sphaerochaeta sp.]|jgi:single-stranded-DNA-specific exonuclease|nr:single-stranded-DNA-specific exonuclease RecJ [Sphaerochaeta sp.]MCH3920473.1 single-stranded-DNA-specific exonuclease RecJ [Sphaerochaeta sp.]MCI2045013.1 single-stranded-DNA-specific exonuclease RecJ [Sphaerochaeta sp.]MCI2076322.1 single-stranded-DNA-specific exonuclease RecJ [Sphaerochaeta sp.]MCI2096875.1 single-stranded-DNA-specific exonuclease RecJ [Sphaerochaeta sp.]
MQWKKSPVSPKEVRNLHERYNVSLLSAAILARRGISGRNDVKFFLENDLSFLHNPFLFDDMETVVDRIQSALDEKEKIRVFGDRDVDGITSTALLVSELSSMGADVSYKLPEGDEPYGMTIAGVDQAMEDGVTLIITVDCGISNFDEIAHASECGIDTLVLDHHLSDDKLPAAMAIIDPKVQGSGYPFEHLAACGVVSKVIWALRFAQTPFYHENCILLHAQPGNGTVLIQAVRLENLMEIDRVREEINPGVVDLASSKAIQFLTGNVPVLVLDSQMETNQLREAFGKKVEISLVDMRGEMEKALPMIKGKSLFTLSTISRTSRYTDHGRDEMETLYSLFASYVRKRCPSLDKDYEKILDLVAIGTVADLMPMIDENRILVRRGIKMLQTSCRPSLVPLMTMQNLNGRELTSQNISWQLAPVLNSAGRMGQPKVAVDMLLAPDVATAETYAMQLENLNKQRQKLGEDAWERLTPLANESMEKSGSKIVVIEDPKMARGITGLMASRLLKKYGVPSLVIADVGDRVSASIRSPEGFNSRDFLSNFADLFSDFGGHACAGGFSMVKENLPVLRKRMEDVVDQMDCQPEEEENLSIDCSLPANYLTPEIIKEVEFFEPYGEQNPQIVFSIDGAHVEDLMYMKNSHGEDQHVKVTLRYGQYKWPAVYWFASAKVGKEFDKGDTVDVAFRISRNYFRQQSSLQLTVLDMKRSEGSSIAAALS